MSRGSAGGAATALRRGGRWRKGCLTKTEHDPRSCLRRAGDRELVVTPAVAGRNQPGASRDMRLARSCSGLELWAKVQRQRRTGVLDLELDLLGRPAHRERDILATNPDLAHADRIPLRGKPGSEAERVPRAIYRETEHPAYGTREE